MINGSMAGHKVEADFDPASVCFATEPVEVPVSTIARRDPVIVIHIITGISERRHKTRIDPHRVDAQPLQVIQFLYYPGDVANAVAVGITEALRVNLVKDSLFEPGGGIWAMVHL